VIVGLALTAVMAGAAAPATGNDERLRYVATASQPGIVGYRDPLGVVSPDGAWLAYTEGRHLRVRRVEGGAVAELLPSDRNLTHLAWLPDARRLASFGRNPDTGESGWRVQTSGPEGRRRSGPIAPRPRAGATSSGRMTAGPQ
jgi:hypothetical protein